MGAYLSGIFLKCGEEDEDDEEEEKTAAEIAEVDEEEVDDGVDDVFCCVSGRESLDDDVDIGVLACALGIVRLFPHPPKGSKISKFPMGLCSTTK